MKEEGISPDFPRSCKNRKLLWVTKKLMEELKMWIYFSQVNSGSAWKTMEPVLIQAEISSDASGKTFAGVVTRIGQPSKVVAGEFWGPKLAEDIQVKEGEALRQTLNMLVVELPEIFKGKPWCARWSMLNQRKMWLIL